MAKKEKRVEVGVPGVDELIDGGIPNGKVVLLAGGPGTGKSTFGLQWLLHGFEKFGQPGLYVSLEQDPKDLIDDLSGFDFKTKKAIEQKGLSMVKSELYKFDSLKNTIESGVDSIGAERIVIDPVTVLSMYWDRPIQARKGMMEIIDLVRKLGCTGMLVSEVSRMADKSTSFPVEEFACDGVIHLGFERKASTYERSLVVRKMRGSNHSTRICPLKITDKGIVVYPEEEVF